MNIAELIQRLKKVPKALWYLLLLVSLFFKNFLIMSEVMKQMPQRMEEFGFDASLMPEITPTVTAFMYIFNALIIFAFFEFIVYLAYNTYSKRRLLYPNISKDEFALPIRVMFSIGNIGTGIVSLIYFLIPKLDIMGFNIVVFAFDSAALILAFILIQANNLIVKGARKPSFSLFTRTYGGIYLVLAIFALLGSLEAPKAELIIQIINLILVLVFFLISGLLQSRFAEKDKDDLSSSPPDEPREIFKGFGF